MTSATELALDLISKWEGFEPHPYEDSFVRAAKLLKFDLGFDYYEISSVRHAEEMLVADPEFRDQVVRRIVLSVDVDPEGCWIWNRKAKSNFGYGRLRLSNAAELRAHRAMYIAANARSIGRDDYVCHKCDKPSCVNPAHLFLGKAADNTADMMAKGRMSPPPVHFGVSHHMATLSFEQVQAIREEAKTLKNYAALGRKYSVSGQTIRRICEFKTRVNA